MRPLQFLVRRRGFTFVEMLVVIVVLGTIAAVALPKFLNLRDGAEQSVVAAWVGALSSAYGILQAALVVRDGPYTQAYDMSLESVVRCDAEAAVVPSDPAWRGHQIALGPIRASVFSNANQTACSYNTIAFDTRSGRRVSIVNDGQRITWTATPPY